MVHLNVQVDSYDRIVVNGDLVANQRIVMDPTSGLTSIVALLFVLMSCLANRSTL